jgi:hypothetical protein
MVNLPLNDEYHPNSYFAARRGEQGVLHCVGDSCDNLVALDAFLRPSETQEVGLKTFANLDALRFMLTEPHRRCALLPAAVPGAPAAAGHWP